MFVKLSELVRLVVSLVKASSVKVMSVQIKSNKVNTIVRNKVLDLFAPQHPNPPTRNITAPSHISIQLIDTPFPVF